MTSYQIIQSELRTWLKEANESGRYNEYFHVLLSDWPYNLDSIQKRFGGKSSAPAKPGKDAAFVRKSKGFLGQEWDGDEVAYEVDTWRAIMPLLKPGGFTAGFSHTRKQYRLATAQEDAGFLIAPAFCNYRSGQALQVPAQLGWIYGSGMPHGTDISKGIDKAAGIEREVIGINGQQLNKPDGRYGKGYGYRGGLDAAKITAPATDLAQIWHGYQYGSPLAPEIEPIIVAQKPWNGHRRNCILETGAGAMNIAYGQSQKVSDRFPGTLILEHHPGCRLVGEKEFKNSNGSSGGYGPKTSTVYGKYKENPFFPAKGDDNGIEMIPDYDCHPDCHAARLGDEKARYFYQSDWTYEIIERLAAVDPAFYCGKVGPVERNAGLSEMPDQVRQRLNPGGLENEPRFANTVQKNHHPTLKPIKLTKDLCGLFAPPKEYAPRRLLIPCAGTGSEMIGALLSGKWDEIIGIEANKEYVQIAESRLAWWSEWPKWGQRDVEKILQAATDKATEAGQMSIFDLVEAA